MNSDVDDFISISDIYIGLEVMNDLGNPMFECKMNLIILQKLPYQGKLKNTITLYQNIDEKKFYHVNENGRVITSKKNKDIKRTFKYLESFEDILNKNLFLIQNSNSLELSEISQFRKIAEQLKQVHYLNIDSIHSFKDYIYIMYLFAYGNPIEKEMNLYDGKYQFSIQENLESPDPQKNKSKKNPK